MMNFTLLNLLKQVQKSFATWTIKKLAVFALLGLMLFSAASHAQYLHRSGKQILDPNGQEIILRGMGLGGWMLQEGYMLETNAFANPQHEIRAAIEGLIGTSNTDAFYEAWYSNHCTKRDIDSLAKWGFNSVRLPMHYNLYTLPVEKEPVAGQNTWLEKGFALTDSLVKWCAANSMYVILDLHAAPGGQGKDAAISDYDATKPSLWESEENKKKTIALWKKLAERYADEKWIGGYDLINETNWNFTPGANKNGCDETTNAPLRKLYIDITNAIREVDQNHIIFIEGNCWANNHNGLFPAWDENMVLSFHKYWNNNDAASLQGVINLRNQHNIPLWMGEGGENSNAWFRSAIDVLESNSIGWAWWPMKKVGSIVNPLTIVKNDGYSTLLNYWQNGGTKPTVQFAKDALMQLTENLKIQNNIYRVDVIDAMFRQVNDPTTRPFKNHVLPGVVHLSDFDLGPYKKAYSDKDTATTHVSTGGGHSPWNNGWIYRNDGVDLENNTDDDPGSNQLNVGWTNDGEWMQYTVTVDSSAAYTLSIRYAASTGSGKIKLTIEGTDKTAIIDLPATGGNKSWATKTVNDVILQEGIRKIRVMIIKGGANLGFLKFALSKEIKNTPFQALTAETSADGEFIYISLNKSINPTTLTADNFNLKVNNTTVGIEEINSDTEHPSRLIIKPGTALNDNDVILIDYSGTAVQATDATPLEIFTSLQVVNNLPRHIALPGIVQAEDFAFNFGLELETTTDTGGGQNIGYTNAGDYLNYNIRVAEDGQYTVEVRVASGGAAGKLELQQLTKDGEVLHTTTVSTPVTGGWQNWQTISATINLSKGSSTLRLKILQPEFNVNWIKFSKLIINSTKDKRQGSLYLYPNPTEQTLHLGIPEDEMRYDTALCIRHITGSIVRQVDHFNYPDDGSVFVGDLSAGLYVIELSSTDKIWINKFIKK